ncbi:cellulose synthase [Burkholderia sp. PAMC 26561]|nr:cellulose synthase [Burkholderia sp. PAMC 26561]
MPTLVRVLPCIALAAGSLNAAAAQTSSQAPDFADAFDTASHAPITRTVELKRLGVRDTVALGAPDSRREYYFPVPAGVPITDAALQVDASYLRGDGGRTTMLVSLDGSPVLARALTQPQGNAAATIGVDGSPRANGYVRVGFEYASVINDAVCADQTAIGNVLRLAPGTRLNYRYNSGDIRDLRTAWSALSQTPAIAISSKRIGTAAYDTAWRAAAIMQRDGREPSVSGWPAVGDTVNLGTPDVPAALRAMPAFAALAAGGEHRLANAAEAGALLAISAPTALPADLIVADNAWRTNVNASLDALRVQAAVVSPEAASAFDDWRARVVAPLVTPLAPGEARLVHVAGQAAIVVGDTRSVGALAQVWRAVDGSNQLVVHQIDSAANGRHDVVPLAALGGVPRTVNVLRQASWTADFDLGAVAGAGRLPDDVVLDLAGSPNGHNSGVVASVFFNDTLIGSKLLDANGRAQRVTSHIPRTALSSRNLLRVTFTRQSDSGCASDEGYPAAVLPTSHLTLVKADADDNFTGMVARFATSASVLVPSAYLADSTTTLPRVARLADATGVDPQRATLTVTSGSAAVTPAGPFLAFDVALADQKSHVQVADARLAITGNDDETLYDVSQQGVGVLDVAHAGNTRGVIWRSVGARAPIVPVSLQLAQADVAVLDGTGVLKEIDTRDPAGMIRIDTGNEAGAPWSERWLSWTVPALLVGMFILLLMFAALVRSRKQQAEKLAEKQAGNPSSK